ncbi:ATP-binding protein [Haloglomus litoreum]|uniref:ATP-binding protein n=1 Tax=Haloglomus litoreum TaxID=3034026 RepID=UPI0023E87540|nr:DUF87 domain-containing protein [Haloglomus sp. DT116]
MSDVPERITVGEGVSLPVMDVLAGRGFVTGKSGSGKSNTASVLLEELLDLGLPVAVIDTDGEYYGLKEEYEVLHVGADDRCDLQVGPGHADRLATLALEEGVPVIVDVSGYLREDDAREVVASFVRALFRAERDARTPFLLLVEEVHEFIPQDGGLDEAGEALVRVAKRGRKRGLGMVGLSQRPAAVDKDVITQCDWLVWHRLTWENDTRVVKSLLGSEAAEAVRDLDAGEALLQADWEEGVRWVRFRRKRTFDAGATPGLEDIERPDLKSVDEALIAELADVDDAAAGSAADVEELREQLATKEARIEELEARLVELEGEDADSGAADASGENETTPDGPTEDPLWEAGRLLVHLARGGGRRAAGVARRVARALTLPRPGGGSQQGNGPSTAAPTAPPTAGSDAVDATDVGAADSAPGTTMDGDPAMHYPTLDDEVGEGERSA